MEEYFGVKFDNFCKSCHHIDNSGQNGKMQKEEIEFYCRSCRQAICRNCLLKYHLNLDFAPSSKKEEQIREK